VNAPTNFRARVSVMKLLDSLRPEPHFPMSAMVEVADRCNETCVHCYQIQGQKGELDTDEWRTIFDELAEMGVLVLTISGGEPTLRKDFLELVAYARKKRFAVKLFTNGLNMTQPVASRLGELAVQEVQISLYSHDPQVHDGVTCVPGSFDKTIKSVRLLRAANVPVVLKTPVMKLNAGAVDEYVALVSSLGADYMMDSTIDPRENGDASPEALRVDDDTYLETRQHEQLASDRTFEERPLKSSVCGACSGHVHIEANGEMRPCTQLQVPVGHALTDGVRHAWAHNEAGRSIRETTWEDLHACRQCDLRSFCGRCFATARAEVGDALAPYPSACRKARLNYQVERGVAPRITGEDRGLGPYRELAEGEFESFAVNDDGSRATPLWAHPPEELVQLRLRSVSASPED